ncbi:MAG: peroxiredoxin-like family protein [Candidatus Hydrogenedentota bacterium]
MSNPLRPSTKLGLFRALCVCVLVSLLVLQGATHAASRYGGASRRDDRLRDNGDADTPSRGSIGADSSPESAKETVRLGMLVRELAQEDVLGLVLMNGMEDIPVEESSVRRGSTGKVTEKLVEALECQVQKTEFYRFFYPQGFEALTQIQLSSLNPVYDDIEAEIVFGANLPLYMVFTWLSQATGKTIIADNLAAAAVTGELSLGKVPLRTGLEAILKSARAIGVGVDSTPNYVFFFHPGRNPYGTKRSLLINNEGLSAEQRALLEQTVNVVLPKTSGTRGPVPFQAGAQPFSKVVQSLSRQVGVPIAIDKALADLPVNPAAFTDVPLRTVLDLLIRQWIYPDIGYEIQKNRIVIRRLIAPLAGQAGDADMKRAVLDGKQTSTEEPENDAEKPDRDTEEAPISADAAKSGTPAGPTKEKVPPNPPSPEISTEAAAEAPTAPAESEAPTVPPPPKTPVEPAVEDRAAAADESEPPAEVQTEEIEALAKQLAEERAAAEAAAQQAAQLKAEAEEALKRLAEERKAAEKAIRKAQELKEAEEKKAAEQKAAAKKAAQEEAAKKAAEQKAAAEKAAQEEAANKAPEEKAADEKAAQEEAAKKAAEQKAADEKAAQEEAAKKAAEQKAAAEKAAQEEAAKKAAEEKAAAEKAAQEEAEKKAAQQKAAAEKVAQEEAAKKAADEKAAQEEATKKATEEKAAAEKAAQEEAEKKAAQQKAADEKAAQEEAAKKAAEQKADDEKAAQEEAAKKAAEQKAAAEKQAKEATTLKTQLEALKAQFQESAKPEVVQAYQEGIKKVAQSGVVDKAKKVGDQAPLFELPTAKGEPLKLDDQLKQGPVVLVWYRGGWCPYCNLHLKAIQKALSQITEQGARVLAISPQKPDHAAKTMEENKLEFQLLADTGNKTAKEYGIAHMVPDVAAAHLTQEVDFNAYNGDTSNELPLAATYIVDEGGIIRYAFVNADYRLRAEPSDIVAALKKLNEKAN